jgi:hypothetical protein
LKWEKSGKTLKVELLGDFNYERVLKIQLLLKGVEELKLELKRASFVDTEAVDFLYNLKLKGFKYELFNRPELLEEVCRILKVEV